MRSYHDQMEDLRFTPEQKAAMVASLLAAGAAPKKRKPHRKRAPLVAAAVLAAALCAACASGALQAVLEGFSEMLGASPEQTKTIENITRPLGASATCDGVTISAEGVMGDAHTLYIFYSMYREDGQPVLPQTEDTKNVSNGDNTLNFETDTFPGCFSEIPEGFWFTGGVEFAEFEVDDTVLYFMQAFTFPNYNSPTGSIDITFENLYSYEWYNMKTPQTEKGLDSEIVERKIPLVDGAWTLSFDLDYKGAAIDLPTGQTFHNEALTGTLQELQISPFALYFSFHYTFDEEALAAAYDPSRTADDKDSWIELEKLSLTWVFPTITLTDGTVREIGTHASPGEEENSISLANSFHQIIPLDTIESITIGDLTIPVKQAGGK